MIGIFDSGVGGFNSLYEVRRCAKSADIIYLADRKNAPYGTKCEDEIISLVKNDIRLLSERGARRILIACCTASTVYDKLSDAEKKICLPIISPAARAAAKFARTAVIATEATVRSRAFAKEIERFGGETVEISAQPLVCFVEEGARDGRVGAECKILLDELAHRVLNDGCDALVLGCTHFSHLEGELASRLSSTEIISPAREGARALINEKGYARGSGRTVYIAS